MEPKTIVTHLCAWLQRTRECASDDVFINELCIVDKARRADLVHANGKLTGFEVKSAVDTLKRWPDQMTAYQQIFDEVWLCCHWKHAQKALDNSAPSVGILIIDDYESIAVLRPAKPNRNVDAFQLTGLLWRSELDELCRKTDLPVYSKEKIREARERIASALPIATIKQEVLVRLKARYSDKTYSSSSPSCAAVRPPASINASTAQMC
jgi:hypothetical protein